MPLKDHQLRQDELVKLIRLAHASAVPRIMHEAEMFSVMPENSITVEFLTVDSGTIDSLVSRLLIELSKIGFSHDIQSYASNLNGDLVKISIEDAKTVKFTIKHNQGTLQ